MPIRGSAVFWKIPRRGTTLHRGAVDSVPAGFYVDFERSGIDRERAGHAAAPTDPRREVFLQISAKNPAGEF